MTDITENSYLLSISYFDLLIFNTLLLAKLNFVLIALYINMFQVKVDEEEGIFYKINPRKE